MKILKFLIKELKESFLVCVLAGKHNWLILMMLLLTISCSGPDRASLRIEAEAEWAHLDKELHRIIPDRQRAAQLSELAEQLRLMADEVDQHMHAYRMKLHDLNADYDAMPEDFQKIFAAQKKWKQSMQERLVAISRAKRSLTTQGEWQQLAKIHIRSLEKSLETIPGFE